MKLLNYSDRNRNVLLRYSDESYLTYTRVFNSGYVHFITDGWDEHRMCGPAWISPEGDIQYNLFGKIHRTDGPAVIISGVGKEYWVHDSEMSPEEFFLKYGVV